MSVNSALVFKGINECVRNIRSMTVPISDEIDKLEILREILHSVSNFESKLLSELDVD
jgi:hypothetical protein